MSKTRMEFEPGLTAIVGPNGCGKSNVSDAVRWVLGEQSAKALRGSKMEDCIFSGTDARKPLGMAQVNITFADCEKALETEYHEVTVSRRVFRSGEGQYFMNNTPCRLKDIQRLFMDTGIGTTSYSLMEQGRIDRVLSARPEDRRAIFEEASGITKFKSDKEEAIRKLQHTEANLLRLADVIREVKRQIISLQRQAGKARRFKTLQDELRSFDVFASKRRINLEDENIRSAENQIKAFRDQLIAIQKEITGLEADTASLRDSRLQTEREKGTMHEAAVQAESKFQHTEEVIRLNQERIAEHEKRSERDALEIDEARKQILERKEGLAALDGRLDEARKGKDKADRELSTSKERSDACQQELENTRGRLDTLRQKSMEAASLLAKFQNQLAELDQAERTTVIQRERLSAEKIQLEEEATGHEKRRQDTDSSIGKMKGEVQAHRDKLDRQRADRESMLQRIDAFRDDLSKLKAKESGKRAQIELLANEDTTSDGFPAGARLLMDSTNPLAIDKQQILGTLADRVDVEPAYRLALEAALRSWLDAVLVANPTSAIEILRKLEKRKLGAARLLVPPAAAPTTSDAAVDGDRLLDHVSCEAGLQTLLDVLIGHVLVVDSAESIPSAVPPGITYVTRNGSLLTGNGLAEYWMPESPESNPLSRKHLVAQMNGDLEDLEKQVMETSSAVSDLLAESREAQTTIDAAQVQMDDARHAMAQKEGEMQLISRQAEQARDRLETVTWELTTLEQPEATRQTERDTLVKQKKEVLAQRDTVTAELQAQNADIPKLESRLAEAQGEATRHTVTAARAGQNVEHLTSQRQVDLERLAELEAIVAGRSTGVASSKAEIDRLHSGIKAAQDQLIILKDSVALSRDKEESLQKNSAKQFTELQSMEAALSSKRTDHEGIREQQSQHEIRLAETRMRRQNLVDHVTSEYNISFEQALEEVDPEWESGVQPPLESVETRVAELRTKLDAMGPVNLVAIQEYREHEDRYTFLTGQERDLVNSKQQLMDMIRKINRTTSEMFQSTFDRVNENFQIMFRKLFNGGTAKLVLVNEEEVLECGIEIIARPAGKRLQNVSLLSGGERTMTAVALLFSIYMIKPSPFCLLDELDAALDDSNIGRFVNVLQDFLDQSQFVVITHNRQTISAAGVVYGVTMEEKGISKIVSMKFKPDEEKKTPEPVTRDP